MIIFADKYLLCGFDHYSSKKLMIVKINEMKKKEGFFKSLLGGPSYINYS